MKLIVGLGNPGKEYENTRHNVGFMIVDNYVQENRKFQKKFNGLYQKSIINNESFILLKPLSFMNLSGIVVKKYVDYFKIKPQDIMIIQDDLDLPTGKIKLKYKGSSGGHNGIKSIINELQTEEFNRFKIGIGNNKEIDTKDYVLDKFKDEEKNKLEQIKKVSNNIIEDFILHDFAKVMSKYNGDHHEIR